MKYFIFTTWHLLSIIVPFNKTYNKIHPKYSEVVVGSDAILTCGKSSSKFLLFITWFFNTQYYISNDTRIEDQSIIIDNVQLNHSGSYQCVKVYYHTTKNIYSLYTTSAELKVFGK